MLKSKYMFTVEGAVTMKNSINLVLLQICTCSTSLGEGIKEMKSCFGWLVVCYLIDAGNIDDPVGQGSVPKRQVGAKSIQSLLLANLLLYNC